MAVASEAVHVKGNRSRPVIAYRYHDAAPTWGNGYLWPIVRDVLESHTFSTRRAFDLGCGNGATADMLSKLGFEVMGVDPSESGIALARCSYPECRFELGSAYDDLAGTYGRFPLVVSLEVVAHCHDPREFAHRLYDLVESGGVGIVSAPYHGYLKNLALALTGKLDAHFTALWDGGFLKFFSIRTLRQLLGEAGFAEVHFIRVGRVPPLARSMVAVVKK